ncbi:uncharacterized protein LOC130170925 [Seriola aureovittata]|uniref:uncharacterized protein LOC130170925 n=1 Tax=Seriola aureovittata TaxID=2871759 RepID=UPI0024BE2570|nr:uncharacterized protein LOC130170925 [Seriola aureovittata]
MKHLTCAINDSPYVKSCEELMSACEELSSDSMDVAQMTLNASLTEESAHSPASPSNHTVPNEDNPAGSSDKPYCFLQRTIITWENSPYKRKRDDDDDDADAPAEDENRNSPDISPAKRGRSQWLALSLTEASGEMSPAESPQHKRKRDDDDDLRITSPAKRWRGINLNKELTDSVKKLLNNSAGAQSSSTEVNYPRKRKRDDEEASGLIEEDHLKKRKRDDEEASGSDQSSTEKRRRETSPL